MSIDKLSKLKDQVDTILHTKVADERRNLQADLAKLSRFSTSQLRSKGLGVRGPVAPKYRNPENPSETWAGRGLSRGLACLSAPADSLMTCAAIDRVSYAHLA